MTTSGSEAKPPGRHVAGSAASPGIDGAAKDAHDDGAPQDARPADARTGPPGDVQELKHEIEQIREQLGETVEQLVAKTDVRAGARDKAAELTGRVKGKAVEARAQAADYAGKARDQLAGEIGRTGEKAMSLGTAAREQFSGRVADVAAPVWEATPEPVRQAVAKGASSASRRRAPLAVAAGMLILGYLTIRWRKRR
jgi:hypothetical protein